MSLIQTIESALCAEMKADYPDSPTMQGEQCARAAMLAYKAMLAVVEASGGPDHIVRADKHGFTVHHPITERFEGTLFECPMFPLIKVAAEGGAFFLGEHRVWLDRGVLQWEEIDS